MLPFSLGVLQGGQHFFNIRAGCKNGLGTFDACTIDILIKDLGVVSVIFITESGILLLLIPKLLSGS
jgi:hypothetical protein